MASEYCIPGGAGFIGSHFVRKLLENGKTVTVIDNFCSGTMGHLKDNINNSDLKIVEMDIENTSRLVEVFGGSRVVIHLASNPDIARAAIDPRIDFVQGTVLTESVVEAVRISGVKQMLYASGSGVYGDAGEILLKEDSALKPISTYGASKLAGESLLSSYSYMFEINTIVFRFANVVGPMQTHGVGYDFLKKLKNDPNKLTILGNGLQNKSYVHVSDIVSGVLMAHNNQNLKNDVFNVSYTDSISVNEIAEIAIRVAGLKKEKVALEYGGGDRGWKGDVPIVRLDPTKITNLGWEPCFNSYEAMYDALSSMWKNMN